MYTRTILHLFYFFIHLFLVVLGLHCCTQDFCSCGVWGLLFHWCSWASNWWFLLLRSRGSRCTGFSSCSNAQALELGLSSCGAQAWLLYSMWNLPDQRLSPCLLHWEANSYPWDHQGSPEVYYSFLLQVHEVLVGVGIFFCHQWEAQHRICGCECLLNVCSNPVILSPIFLMCDKTLRLHLVGKVKWWWSV